MYREKVLILRELEVSKLAAMWRLDEGVVGNEDNGRRGDMAAETQL